METESHIDTGVSTINKNIQSLLAEKNYSPSYIVRVINRAIPDTRYTSYQGIEGLRKGHFMENNQAFHQFTSSDIKVRYYDNKQVEYPNLTMPGLEGQTIINSLDSLVTRNDPATLSIEDMYHLLAVMAITVGSAHAFPDGTGRSAIGLVDVMMRKYLKKSLDLEKLQPLDQRLTTSMTMGSLLMLPDTYNLNTLLQTMNPNEVKKVAIPQLKTHSLEEIQAFTKQYADNILQTVNNLDIKHLEDLPSGAFSLYKDSILPIADLFKEVSVDIDT